MDTFKIADNRMFRVHHRDYLFLAAENALFEMDGETMAMLNTLAPWTRSRGRTREEMLSRLRGPGADRAEEFERLLRTRVIVPSDNGAREKTAAAPRGPIPLKTLVLHVTGACNLGCRYCYYRGGEQPGRGASMTPGVAERAVDFLLERSGPLDAATLVFFGGEPLLNFQLITRVVDYATRAASDRGKTIDFAITSNGTLFTEEVVAFLHENNVGVTVSMDGLPRVHDRYRRFPDGSPSYDRILPGVKRLLRDRGRKPVVARVTTAGEPRDLSAALDHLLDMGFSEAGFAPVTTRDPAFQLDPGKMDRLLGEFTALSDRFL
ncbi:MAG: radical SAM protein, partial [Desulfobacterales bacterium]|nr:radical SAM protein [Desulfobacterales bacterium]